MSCPGRGAAFFTLLRRAGTHSGAFEAWTPDQPRITRAPTSSDRVKKTRGPSARTKRCLWLCHRRVRKSPWTVLC